jgi:hypothetical protein
MVTQQNKITDILSEASTLSSISINTQNVSKNVLNKYASYNYLFTLSGLSTVELQNCTFFNGPPHDIIARSAGIGEQDNSFIDDDGGLASETASTLSRRGIESLLRDRQILNQSRDLYFQSVEMDSLHGMNSERGTAPITKINMIIVEPTGISLFNKMRAAAANNGFRDHVNAPYLLTVTFRGFNELGQNITDDKDTVTRYIPIKIFKCDLKLTQAGSEYSIQAVPHNETPYMDRFLYTRSVISLTQKSTIWSYMHNLEIALNTQTQDEADQTLFENGKQDEYKIVLHPDLASETMEPVYKGKNNLKEIAMSNNTETAYVEASEGAESVSTIGYDTKGGQIAKSTSILKIIEQAMKSVPTYRTLVDKWFDRTIKATTNKTGKKLFTAKDVASYLDSDPSSYFVDWFRVKSSIEILPEFDNITKQQKKRITFYIYPYKVHVYKLPVPGVSLGAAGSYNAKKIYDYLFTGNNTEVLDLDIEYKMAYYQTALKDVDANYMSSSAIDFNTKQPGTQRQLGSEADSVEALLPLQQNVGTATTASTGATVQTYKLVDVFMDQLTNPQADMVQIRLDIMGDPAWIPQTQFMPIRTNSTISEDENLKAFKNANGNDVGWNTRFGNFNTDIADPIILINFKMPTDINDRSGLYRFQDESNGMFSGLYQVYKTTHNFNSGKFMQTLHCVRFNNQSNEKQGTGEPTEYALGPDGDIVGSSNRRKQNLTATEGSL